jgi:hypothetical protein
MDEEIGDENEENEAKAVDRCTPSACARRRVSCLRKGMACGRCQKGFKKGINANVEQKSLDVDRGARLSHAVAD